MFTSTHTFHKNGTPVIRCILFRTLIYTWRKLLDFGVNQLAKLLRSTWLSCIYRRSFRHSTSFFLSFLLPSKCDTTKTYFSKRTPPTTLICLMLFHHIFSALYAIVFSAMALYSGALASPLPLPLAFMTPGYGRLVSTRNSSVIRQGDASPATAPHHLDDFFTNKGHSLHRRGENYVYLLLKTYKVATISGFKFCELGWSCFPPKQSLFVLNQWSNPMFTTPSNSEIVLKIYRN